MVVAVFGGGLVGRRAAAQLAHEGGEEVWLVGAQRMPAALPGVQVAARWLPEGVSPTAAIVATEPSQQVAVCERLISAGIAVVSAAGEPEVVKTLWSLAESARVQVPVVVGAAYAPGLSSLLAAQLMQRLDQTHEVDISIFGTGGPACARAHHRAMSSPASEVREGTLHRPRSGTGRQLVWFPEPVGGVDCYFGGLADPFLMHLAFPEIDRVQARMAATRRDRMTSRLPMLRSPHPEGLVGAVVVEVRGARAGQIEHHSLAVTAPQATGAAFVAAAVVGRCVSGGLAPGPQSVVSLEDPLLLLHKVAQNFTVWAYDGTATTSADPAEMRAAERWKRRN